MASRFKLMTKLGLKTIKENLYQFIALIFIGIISVTIYIGLMANALTFQTKVKVMYDRSNIADISVTLNPKYLDTEKDEKKINDVIGSSGKIEKRFYTYATLNSYNAIMTVSEKYPSINKESRFLAKSDLQTDDYFFVIDRNVTKGSAINELIGNQDNDDSVAKVSLDLSMLDINKDIINMADVFLKEGKSNPFKAGKLNLSFKVTGIMESAENITHTTISPYTFYCSNKVFKDKIVEILKDTFTDFGSRLIYSSFSAYLGWGDGNIDGESINFPKANQYLIDLNDDTKINDIKKELKEYFNNKEVNNLYQIQTKTESTNYTTITTDARQAKLMGYIFPIVFFMVSVLIIIASLRQVATKDRMQIGTLKAMGFSNNEIYLYYFSLFGGLNLFSTIIGLILGPIIIPKILNVKYKALYTLPTDIFRYPYLEASLTALLFLLVTLFITYIAIRRVAVLHPSVSMRPKTNKAKHLKSKKVTNYKIKTPIYLSIKMSIKDITKDMVKTLMVILGVLGCVMLLVCGFGIEDMGGYGVKHDSFINSGADYTLNYLDEVEISKTNKDLRIKENDKDIVLGYQPYSTLSTEVEFNNIYYETNLNIVGNEISFIDEKLDSHYKINLSKDEALISEKLVEELGIKKGDKITFTFRGKKIEAKVYDTVYEFYTNGIYLPADSYLFSDPVTKFKNAWIDINEEIDSNISLKKLKSIGYVTNVITLKQAQELVNTVTSLLTSMTNAIKFFAIALAIVVMFNIALMNYNEKLREIATLKVLGFKRYEISFSLISTILITTFIGSGLGLLLGKPFMRLVLYVNRVQAVCFNSYISFKSYLISFLIGFGVSLVVNIILALRTNKIKMVESLKSIE